MTDLGLKTAHLGFFNTGKVEWRAECSRCGTSRAVVTQAPLSAVVEDFYGAGWSVLGFASNPTWSCPLCLFRVRPGPPPRMVRLRELLEATLP